MIHYADVVTGTGVYPSAQTFMGVVNAITVSSLAAKKTLKVSEVSPTTINPTLIGKWVYANDQCRKIVGTRDGVYIYLEKDFDAPVVAATLNIVDRVGGQISFVNLSPNQITVNDGIYGGDVGNTYRYEPIWYVLGVNEMQIEIQYP